MTSKPAIRLNDLRFAYDDNGLTLNFNCAFEQGAITAIMGASGAGKSTMLSLIAGFEIAQNGTIEIESLDMTKAAPDERPLSFVFQEHNLFAHLNIFRNVGLGISPSLRLDSTAKAQIDDALAKVGLSGFGDRLPSQLSGGERQRVALARVLVRKKPILLLDEAFASLGPGLRSEMLDLVAKLKEDNGLTVLMVTHAPEDALRIAKNLIFIDHSGVIYDGPVSVLESDSADNAKIIEYLGARS